MRAPQPGRNVRLNRVKTAMRDQRVHTGMGQVSLLVDDRSGDLPIVFMHGVFLDKTLWTALALITDERASTSTCRRMGPAATSVEAGILTNVANCF